MNKPLGVVAGMSMLVGGIITGMMLVTFIIPQPVKTIIKEKHHIYLRIDDLKVGDNEWYQINLREFVPNIEILDGEEFIFHVVKIK